MPRKIKKTQLLDVVTERAT